MVSDVESGSYSGIKEFAMPIPIVMGKAMAIVNSTEESFFIAETL